MPVTTVVKDTVKSVLDKGNLNQVGDALALAKLGTILTPTKVTLTGLTGTTHNITDAAHGGHPAILSVIALRVTAATTAGSVGAYVAGDAGATVVSPAASTVVGVAKLSDDGTTLTFATGDVTAFVIEYVPRAAVDMTAPFARS